MINGTLEISIHVGNLELLTSGIVHLDKEEPITIRIDDMKFIFEFKNDNGEPRFFGSVKDDSLIISLFNHKNQLGEGMMTPIGVATLDNRPLLVTYYATTFGSEKNIRRFEYAFYLGDNND